MVNYSSKTRDRDCIFCKIASGEIQPLGNGMFWENETHMAWLSPFPNTEGFSIVIPKEHFSSDILEMPEKDRNELLLASIEVSELLKKYFKDVGRVGVLMEGLGIDHAHVKLFPMHGTEFLKKGEWEQVHSNCNDFFDKYPGYIISNDSLRADDKKLEELAKQLRKLKE